MKKILLYSLILLSIVCTFAGCSFLESSMDDYTKNVYYVGIQAATDIMGKTLEGKYQGTGGVDIKVDGPTTFFTFTNCSDTFTSYYSGATVAVSEFSGDGRVSYENQPSTYPNITTVNVQFMYNGKRHSVQAEAKFSSEKSANVQYVFVDGTQYEPSCLN